MLLVALRLRIKIRYWVGSAVVAVATLPMADCIPAAAVRMWGMWRRKLTRNEWLVTVVVLWVLLDTLGLLLPYLSS